MFMHRSLSVPKNIILFDRFALKILPKVGLPVSRDETGSDSFRPSEPFFGFGNEFGYFFSETKTNTVRVLSVGIGKRSETIRIFFSDIRRH
jgi:hypothetical protein